MYVAGELLDPYLVEASFGWDWIDLVNRRAYGHSRVPERFVGLVSLPSSSLAGWTVARHLRDGLHIGERGVAAESRERLKKFVASVWRVDRMIASRDCASLHTGHGHVRRWVLSWLKDECVMNRDANAKVSRSLGRAVSVGSGCMGRGGTHLPPSWFACGFKTLHLRRNIHNSSPCADNARHHVEVLPISRRCVLHAIRQQRLRRESRPSLFLWLRHQRLDTPTPAFPVSVPVSVAARLASTIPRPRGILLLRRLAPQSFTSADQLPRQHPQPNRSPKPRFFLFPPSLVSVAKQTTVADRRG